MPLRSDISACDLLLERSYIEFWKRGESYVSRRKVQLVESDDRHAVATASGTGTYRVELSFRGGGISKRCTCPYAKDGQSRRPPCKHMIAAAILWDEARGMRRPSAEDIEKYTIPPPLVTRAQITACYDDPLHADLEVLRLASDEFALSPRPHARLPQKPALSDDATEPLTLEEVKRAFRDIEQWERRRAYDRYFCAGEMVAAFCEVLRCIHRRCDATPSLVAASILREAQKFHYTLILELIDDSEGEHVFTEAHLTEFHRLLRERTVPEGERAAFARFLQEYEDHRDNY